MRYIISRYNHDVSWITDYTKDFVMYDRSPKPLRDPRVIEVPNLGTDIHDKFTYIIDNYDNLPDVAVYTKANIFKYISREEFEKIKDNTTLTPILTQHHKVYEPVCRYVDGIYEEINNLWYLGAHPVHKSLDVEEFMKLLGIHGKKYVRFAPGSNYILTKEDIRRHPKEYYEKLRSYLEWDVYPGEAQVTERALYTIWHG